MERRTFIRSGVAAGVTAAGLCSLEGCATGGLLSGAPRALDGADVSRRLAELRDGAAVADLFSFGREGTEDLDAIGRRATGVLSTTQRFRDMPLETQLHPEMQAYMHRAALDVDDVVWRHTSEIRATGLLDDPGLDAALRSSGDPGIRFLESFDEQAARTGLSARKRMRLRAIGLDSLDRMRHEGAGPVLLDAQAKVDRMFRTAAALGSAAEADRRATVLRVGEERYEERRREIGEIVDYWDGQIGYSPELYAATAQGSPLPRPEPKATKPTATETTTATETPTATETTAATETPGATAAPGPTEDQLRAAYERGLADAKGRQSLESMKNARYEAGTRTMKTGAWIMGSSLIIAGIGGILALANPWVTVVMSGTIGGVLLITGLIVLSVGAGMRRRASRLQT